MFGFLVSRSAIHIGYRQRQENCECCRTGISIQEIGVFKTGTAVETMKAILYVPAEIHLTIYHQIHLLPFISSPSESPILKRGC